MNIEIKEGLKGREFGDTYAWHSVFLDGKDVGYADPNYDEKVGSYVQIYFDNLNEIFKYGINELFERQINTLAVPIDSSKFSNLDWINQDSLIIITNENEIYASIHPNILESNKQITFIQFIKKLQELFEDDGEIAIEYEESWDILEDGFFCYFNLEFASENIELLYDEILETLDSKVSFILEESRKELGDNSLINIFTFPAEIQSSCEQYLVYFSKFLEDIGISATTRIESDTKNTLFTVIPDNSSEALSKIRDALNIYLTLPEIPDLQIVAKEYPDVGVQQLVSNIYHLNSQLLLARSMIQLKDATIENLKFTNYQKTILIESKRKEKPNEEKTLDGLVTINEFEGKGFKINLPEIFRRITRRLK